ncbi:MAG: GWxTD domain-containing protein [candidate division WOR-3 bacterium]
MKNLLIFVSCLLAYLLAIGSELSFDYSVFWVKDSQNFVECYYSLPYSSLPFTLKGDTSSSSLSLYLYIDGLLRDSLSRFLSVPKGLETSPHLSIIDGFGFFQRKGVYPFELVFLLGKKEKRIALIDTIFSFDFQNSPSLSSILLATYLGADSLTGRFYRNGFWFNPNPSCLFNRSKGNLAYAYLEVYNLTENGPYEVEYKIKGPVASREARSRQRRTPRGEKEQEWSIGKKIDTARMKNFVLPLAFSIRGLKEDNYTLKVSVTDLVTGKKVVREKDFWVQEEASIRFRRIDTLSVASPRDEEEVFLLIASAPERENFQRLSPEDKARYLSLYFQKVDYSEIKNRLSYIDEKFGRERRKGERARIILKYGIPDEIESHHFKENVRAHEHWYYHDRNYHFIFMTIHDIGEPILLWSNVKEERNYPGWERFIDPEEYEILR